jgi:hypothetical protein
LVSIGIGYEYTSFSMSSQSPINPSINTPFVLYVCGGHVPHVDFLFVKSTDKYCPSLHFKSHYRLSIVEGKASKPASH